MEQIALLSPEEQEEALKGLDMDSVKWDWSLWGRPEQMPPNDDSWNVGLFLAGRGAGKTRAAAEWIRLKARGEPKRFLLVARTAGDVREVVVEGEALALDTLVASPTSPTGFVPIGKIKKGDTVVGGDGLPCKVKEVFEVLYNRPCYAVKLMGRDEPIIADANHKWLVRRRSGHYGTGRMNVKSVVMTTEEIMNDLDRRYYIDFAPIQGDALNLPYSPYNVGKILGKRPFKKDFTDHNATTRHIPEDYFWASREQREQLLQGLIDARDGLGEGYELPATNAVKIRSDINRLAASLGYQTYEYTRRFKHKSWTSVKFHSKRNMWAILSIKPVDSVPVRCIAVDSPDNTFLITDSYVKTHNSGIMAVSPDSEKPTYRPAIRRLDWPNGSRAFCLSADEPDGLRGVQAHYSWGDELAAWRLSPDGAGLTAWDNLRFATRLGKHPQVFATTTPKRVPILFDLMEEGKKNGKVWITRGSTFDNAGPLGSDYLDAISSKYENTYIARQELYGEMLDAIEGALWDDEMIENARTWDIPPYTAMRVIGVDPTVAEEPGDDCGIVVVSSTADHDLYKRQAWVLEDASLNGSPQEWAEMVVRMHHKWGAPVIAEINQGGTLVKSAIHQIDPSVPVFEVHSKVGKKLRAEPIALAYQQGRVHHFGRHADLETQMVTWEPENTRKSPDRIDALVHALTALLIMPPKGFGGGPVRAKALDRSINLGGLRNRPTRGSGGPTAKSAKGFRIGGIRPR